MLFKGCSHIWEEYDRIYVHSEFGIEKMILLQKCKLCGKIKKLTIRG